MGNRIRANSCRTILFAGLIFFLAAAAAPSPGGTGAEVTVTPIDNYAQWREALDAGQGTDPATFSIVPGFEIDLVRSAKPEEGSWIALAFDPQGRAVISKEDRGLLRLTLAPGSVGVEVVDERLEEVRGLLFAHGALYANANRSRGLYRLRDTTGDDRFDETTLLLETRSGGHGRNALALAPDGSILMINGDSVDFPPGAFLRMPPTVPGLLPGEQLPRGHLVRMSPGGETWEVVASGLRNPFGVAVNTDGEIFTYDADAEHDMGSPWYRPTHVRHLVTGADFGWRRVTGRWPPYYADKADNPPTTLEVGKGSPTAVKFGTRSHFPPHFRRALFILDWAYGRILAVHLTPQGASYAATAELFLRGRPLNVTDLDFGPDGAMYFVTGGRNTQSALYRVRYTGPSAPSEAFPGPDADLIAAAAEARALRRALEAFHGREHARAIGFAWDFLDHADPWIAYAARTALEHQPASGWAERALDETGPRALPALLALMRVGPDELVPAGLERLATVEPAPLSDSQAQVFLRILEIAHDRLGPLPADVRPELIYRVESFLARESAALNREASRWLLQLKAPGAVARTVALLAAATRQEDRLHYLFLLRDSREGWTQQDRLRYFRALAQAGSFRGGAGMPKFLAEIRSEALAALGEADRPRYVAMLDAASHDGAETQPPAEPRAFVRNWTVAELEPLLHADGSERSVDLERGRALYTAAKCILCHQIGSEGRPIGPDLSEVAARFSRRDILESIIEPSRVVAESYRLVRVTTTEGETIVGRLALEGDFRLPVLRILEDPFATDRYREIPKSAIASVAESPISSMPPGLLNTLTGEEILDLLAYLESGGAGRP